MKTSQPANVNGSMRSVLTHFKITVPISLIAKTVSHRLLSELSWQS